MSNQINEGAARYQAEIAGQNPPERTAALRAQSPQQLVTDHLDLWTSTVTPKSTSGRGRGSGKNSKLELTGIKKLRELILELAVRGKLVAQNPDDEPASKLLERIEAEKAQLIKDGKLKKQKPLAAVSEDEKPFVLPEGWSWVRQGSLVEVLDSQRKPISKASREPGPVPYYGASGVVDHVADYIFDEPLVLVGEDGAKWGKGESTAFRIEGRTWVNNHAHVLKPYRELISDSFLVIYLTSADLINFITGMTVPKLNQARLVSIPVPLPPLAEQQRIVAKVDELMALCDQLEQQSEHQLTAHQQLTDTLLATLTESANAQELNDNWQRLAQHFDLLFSGPMGAWAIDRLKDTILQLAVMGKLVPQNAEDEPASKLLERIEEEKARLVKESKIKKPKKLPAVSDDEKPFELPEGWEWSRIGKVANACDYGTSVKSSTSANGIPVVSMGQIQNGSILLENLKSIPTNTPEIDTLLLKYGDLLYNRTNSAELVGKTGIFLGNSDKYTYASYLIRIRLSHATTEPFYINHVMNSPRFREIEIFPHVKQQCGQANVNGTIMQNMRIPLPPLAEQRRIVAKVDELFALCDQLKDRLQQASETEQHLTNAIVEQALG